MSRTITIGKGPNCSNNQNRNPPKKKSTVNERLDIHPSWSAFFAMKMFTGMYNKMAVIKPGLKSYNTIVPPVWKIILFTWVPIKNSITDCALALFSIIKCRIMYIIIIEDKTTNMTSVESGLLFEKYSKRHSLKLKIMCSSKWWNAKAIGAKSKLILKVTLFI